MGEVIEFPKRREVVHVHDDGTAELVADNFERTAAGDWGVSPLPPVPTGDATDPAGSVVCTACAGMFGDRSMLELHWSTAPDCYAALTRPVGMFGAAPMQPNDHCPACHDSRARCTVHGDACPNKSCR